VTPLFAGANGDSWRGAVCDGCGMPIGSCFCSGTPWDSLNDGTCYGGPEYRLNVLEPPPFWRKKDRDEWHRQAAMNWEEIERLKL
jgi:hypothetical protein